jgi:hypothetical protein
MNQHHPDCDGWRTEHRVTIEVTETSSQRTPHLYRASCDECGLLYSYFVESERQARKFASGHEKSAECDGRCQLWDDLAADAA